MDWKDFDPGKKIVVVGTVFMDIKGYPEGEFYPTGRNKGRIEYTYGGVARNVAENLTGLGYHPVFVSMADQEGAGARCVSELEKQGVVTDYILREENCIGTWMVILTPEGDVCANLSRRQDLMPLCEYLNGHGEEIFHDACGVLVEMDVEEPVVAEVFSWAERYDIPVYGVISNMTIAMERIRYIRKTACFVCNRQEAGLLFGEEMEFMMPEEIQSMMPDAMKRSGIRSMVITMDKDGAVYAQIRDDETICGICPAIPSKVVDSTGAGDSFFTGVAAGLIEGMALKDACGIGTRMASQVIGKSENVFRGYI